MNQSKLAVCGLKNGYGFCSYRIQYLKDVRPEENSKIIS